MFKEVGVGCGWGEELMEMKGCWVAFQSFTIHHSMKKIKKNCHVWGRHIVGRTCQALFWILWADVGVQDSLLPVQWWICKTWSGKLITINLQDTWRPVLASGAFLSTLEPLMWSCNPGWWNMLLFLSHFDPSVDRSCFSVLLWMGSKTMLVYSWRGLTNALYMPVLLFLWTQSSGFHKGKQRSCLLWGWCCYAGCFHSASVRFWVLHYKMHCIRLTECLMIFISLMSAVESETGVVEWNITLNNKFMIFLENFF